MNVASLVLGIIGLVIALLPTLGITQALGMLLGIVALILGILGRKKSSERDEPTGAATAGIVLGIIAVVLGGALFASCMYCQYKVGNEVQKELKKSGGFKGITQDIFGTKLCTTPVNGICVKGESLFSKDSPAIYLSHQTQYPTPTFTALWLQQTNDGMQIKIGKTTGSTTKILKEGKTFYQIATKLNAPKTGFENGSYRVQLKLGARTMTRQFVIR